jgi:hypothetical protein
MSGIVAYAPGKSSHAEKAWQSGRIPAGSKLQSSFQ